MCRFKCAVAAALMLVCLASPEALARKRGILPIHWGEEIDAIAEVKFNDAGEEVVDARGVKVGYHYSRFGLLWALDIWSWGGKYCLYDEANKTYEPISREQAAKFAGHEVSPSGEYKYPYGAVVIGGLTVLGILVRVVKSKAKVSVTPPPASPPAPNA